MRSRIVQILSIGGIAVMLMHLVPDYLAWHDRYKDEAVLRQEEQLRQYEKERAFQRANAKTEDRRTLVSYWYDRDFEKEKRRFRVSDGIDRYEAWLLATTYFGATYGVCGAVDLPQKHGTEWRIAILIGSPGRPGVIVVDAQTGTITSEGKPTITNPLSFLAHPEVPNQSLEPTSGTVTPRASSPTSK